MSERFTADEIEMLARIYSDRLPARLLLEDAGFEPKVGFWSDDYGVMQGFISAGLGFTLLPDLALPTLRDDLVVRATDPPAPERRVWAVTRAEGARPPAAEEMVSILVEVGEAFALRSRERLRLVA